MLVSIIIPIYNVAPYVEKCLRSVMAQTYKKLEVIIVDDCGTDNSMEIVKALIDAYDKKDIKFRILHHEKNRGLSAARNTGIKAATGEYLFFLDSDDYIMPLCIEFMMKYAVKYKGIDMVQGGYTSNTPKAVEWTHSSHLFPKGTEYLQAHETCRQLLQQKKHLPMVQNRLIRRSFITENNLFFEEGIGVAEDNLWTFMAGRHIKDMAFCNIPTYCYRYRPASIMTSLNKETLAHGTAVVCAKILSTLSLDRWLLTELRFVWWRMKKARSMGITIKQLIHEY